MYRMILYICRTIFDLAKKKKKNRGNQIECTNATASTTERALDTYVDWLLPRPLSRTKSLSAPQRVRTIEESSETGEHIFVEQTTSEKSRIQLCLKRPPIYMFGISQYVGDDRYYCTNCRSDVFLAANGVPPRHERV